MVLARRSTGLSCVRTEFVHAIDNETNAVRTKLLEEYYVVIDDLEPSNSSVTNPTHYTFDTITSASGGFVGVINELILILLLCVYMLSTRTMRTVDDHEMEQQRPHEMTTLQRIEAAIRHYVILKAKLSALTGGLVLFILFICGVKLWLVWGVLTFVLNFIPNVGSAIAMVLPIPVILVDQTLSPGAKAAGILLPAVVQMYIGNVMEPALFGKSLNLTALSVLAALVLWSSIWGLYGAILSVPLLGVVRAASPLHLPTVVDRKHRADTQFKILLDATDYPLAKQILNVIREDNSIEEGLEMTRTGGLANLTLLPTDPLAEKAAREQEKAEADRQRAARGQDVTAIVQAVPVNGNQATSNGRFYRQEEEPQEFYDGDEGPFTGSVQSDRAAQPVRPLCAASALRLWFLTGRGEQGDEYDGYDDGYGDNGYGGGGGQYAQPRGRGP